MHRVHDHMLRRRIALRVGTADLSAWQRIANVLNAHFAAEWGRDHTPRSAKQCKERWTYHLNPQLKKHVSLMRNSNTAVSIFRWRCHSTRLKYPQLEKHVSSTLTQRAVSSRRVGAWPLPH